MFGIVSKKRRVVLQHTSSFILIIIVRLLFTLVIISWIIFAFLVLVLKIPAVDTGHL